mmetsp:Transcript_31070/g.60994  ORF Transcript_31070/g.60994 Transcript_31070/m.60994 type:complete len:256 (-) Transcript_31070:557-1324(-)
MRNEMSDNLQPAGVETRTTMTPHESFSRQLIVWTSARQGRSLLEATHVGRAVAETWSASATSNLTITAVMLSPPRPFVSLKSRETQSSKRASKASRIALGSHCLDADRRLLMKSTTSWLLLTSQTPSQQSTRNSSSLLRNSTRTSGVALMICFSGPNFPSFLYSRSPRARDRLRFPFTRYWPGPQFSTYPPAASIRFLSVGSFGLWSSLKATARPARQSTARLSPAFATTSRSFVMAQTQAVQPMRLTSTGRSLD